jgi:hypothetical protein
MRVAVLADIHGNLPGLEGVLAEITQLGVDRLVSTATSPEDRWLARRSTGWPNSATAPSGSTATASGALSPASTCRRPHRQRA